MGLVEKFESHSVRMTYLKRFLLSTVIMITFFVELQFLGGDHETGDHNRCAQYAHSKISITRALRLYLVRW